MIFTGIYFFVRGIIDVNDKNGTIYTKREIFLSTHEIDKHIRFGDYLHGMNLYITIDNKTVDPINNPFFKLSTYVVNPMNARTGANEMSMLGECLNETTHLRKYAGKLLDVDPLANNTACFRVPDNINIRSNWW